jgi:DNA-binding SARP family transcriptional activator
VQFSVGSVPGGPARPEPGTASARDRDRPLARGRLLSDVFDVSAAGILVVSAQRRILTWNPALADMLPDVLGPAATCCEVFGCRTPDTPLAGVCLTEKALATRRPDELVLNLPRANGALKVRATPFQGGRERTILFEVGPAPQPVAPPARLSSADWITIRVLGDIVVETAAGPLKGDWLDQRAGRLLKFLVAHRGTPVHADAIAESLWPGSRADTTNTVRHFVHGLREKLEPERGRYQRSAFVLARNGGYQLNPECVRVDADEFESAAKAGLAAFAAGDRERAIPRLEEALALYHGDFLADERYEDWAIAERERLRDLACKPLRALADLSGDGEQAAGYLERLAEMEPLDVDVHRELIGVWLRQGRRSRAVRHYRAVQSRLMREFGERVNFDLAELARGKGPRADGHAR